MMRTKVFFLLFLAFQSLKAQNDEGIVDKPLHPDPDLVADILGQRPDVVTTESGQERPSPAFSPPAQLPSLVPAQPDACGGHLIAKVNEVDTLFSPGYPQSYPSDLHCVWTLKAPPGYKIVGQFIEFDLTDSLDCLSDYVQISGVSSRRDYYNRGQEVRRHCGKIAPEDFLLGDSAVELVFHTNQGDACKGFAFQYRVETSHVTCGEVSSGSEFEFTNLEYPASVQNETQHCSIQVSHDCEKPICQLRLDLIDFELASPTAGNCQHDQFIIRANEPLPILCGKTICSGKASAVVKSF